MSWLRFLRRGRWDAERRRELESYLDVETDDNIARGMSQAEARAAALRKLGNRTLLLEEVYTMNTVGWLDTTWRDIRYGGRVLLRQPAFAVVAITSLALGVGANTAIFQLIDTVRLRTLPVERPAELARVTIDAGENGRTGRFTSRYSHLTYPLYERIRDDQHSFASLAAWGPVVLDLATAGESRPAQGIWVSGNFFSTLGVTPALGRLIGPDDDRRDCPSPAAVISYPFWQREYAGRSDVVGRTIRLDGHPFQVAGVTPATFFGVEVGRQFDVALPICTERQIRGRAVTAIASNDWWWLAGFGRLKPGVTIERASAELQAISSGIFVATVPAGYTADDAESYRKFVVKALPVHTGFSSLRGDYGTPLVLLLALAGLVLMIACGNLANLMLARASAREHEMAVRLAIGASRWALVRQLMSESLIVAAIGSALGAWLAHGLSGLLVSFLSTPQNPLMLDLAVNLRVLGFTAGLAIVTCLLFGLVPAIRATRTAPVAAMRASGRGLTDGRGRFTVRRGLVIGQLAISLVLLVGALLFVRTFQNLATVNVGFTTAGVMSVDFDFRRANVAPEAQVEFQRLLMEQVRALPGIIGATPVSIVPISGTGWNQSVVIDGKTQTGHPNVNQVGGEYFTLLDIPLTSGRTFNEHDTPASPRAAVVTRTFVDRYLQGGDPIGRVFSFETGPGEPSPPMHVVGVVADTKYSDVRTDTAPLIFLAYSQDPSPGASLTTLVRVARPGTSITREAVALANRIHSNMLVSVGDIERQMSEALGRERLMAMLSGFFGGLALLLAAIGLYGVMSYMVQQRRQEIGIRMALGAGRARVLRMVLGESAVLVTIGVVAGAGLAIFASRYAKSLLFGLTPNDPVTILAAVIGLGVIGCAASFIPAWRAARVEPTTALRE
ncbi:MAG: ABC transporter permease [Vicinamibacterales bacterium]